MKYVALGIYTIEGSEFVCVLEFTSIALGSHMFRGTVIPANSNKSVLLYFVNQVVVTTSSIVM